MKFEFQDDVVYRQTHLGGYGYDSYEIPAKFLRYTPKRAVIRVYPKNGGYADIAVHPYNITAKQSNGEPSR